MKNRLSIIIIGFTIIAAFISLYSCTSEKNEQENKTEKEQNKIEEYYTCPMHPQIVRDKFGTCPICGMDLVKKQKELHDTAHVFEMGDVNLSPAQEATINVETSQVISAGIKKDIKIYGMLEFPESNRKVISARFKGRIEKLFVKATGEQISAGNPLFAIYSPDLVVAQEEMLNSVKSNSMNPANYSSENARKKLLLWGVTDKQLDEIQSGGKAKQTINILSPYTGLVVKKNIFEGQYINEGIELFEISALNPLWLKANIYESDISNIKNGQVINFKVSSYGNETFSGKINLIYPEIDQATRTAQVRVEVLNKGMKLKPGMYAAGEIKLRQISSLVIPRSSAFLSGNKYVVWVQKEKGRYSPRIVQLGSLTTVDNLDGEFYQVISGLEQGEVIVTSSGFLIDSESKLRSPAGANPGHKE